ncbi:hypothetical protein ACZ90_10130 [Streptomyces albus subsp. albus]|nr:hypothetical protein ACZ90_10130 [Streptomyces albus subsp. albus]
MSAPTLDRRSGTRSPRPARRARHPLLAEVRRGPARWIALAALAVDALQMVKATDSWQGGWAQTQHQLHMFAVLVLSPFAAATGCWAGAREHRSHVAELRACGTRSRLAQFLVAAVPVAFAVVVGHAVTTAGSLLASWPYTSGGRPLFGPIAADLVFLASAAFIGAVVGGLAPGRLTAPALGIGLYLLLGCPTDSDSPARFLSPAVGEGYYQMVPVWWQSPAMMLWAGGLATAAVLVRTLPRRWSWSAVVPLALAVVGAVPIARAGEDMWHQSPWARTSVCDDSKPKVCVRGDQKDLLPQVSAALSGVIGRLEGVRHLPDFGTMGFMIGQDVVRGELTDPQRFVWEFTATLVVPECDPPLDGYVHEAVRDWLVSNELAESRRTLQAKRAYKDHDEKAIAYNRAWARGITRLAAMDDDTRRAWLSRYFKAVGSCDAEGVPAL